MLANSVGLEALVLLLVIQVKLLWPSLRVLLGSVRDWFCVIASDVISLAVRSIPGTVGFRPVAIFVCPMLLLVPPHFKCLSRRT